MALQLEVASMLVLVYLVLLVLYLSTTDLIVGMTTTLDMPDITPGFHTGRGRYQLVILSCVLLVIIISYWFAFTANACWINFYTRTQ